MDLTFDNGDKFFFMTGVHVLSYMKCSLLSTGSVRLDWTLKADENMSSIEQWNHQSELPRCFSSLCLDEMLIR